MGSDDEDAPFVIPIDTLNQIHSALSKKDVVLLTSLLSSDRLFPQLASVHSRLRSIFLRAEYCCTEERNEDNPAAYRHDSLCLDEYTHFTSPMRRYIDIEVQRMLLEHLKEPGLRMEFQHEDNLKLCSVLNTKGRSAREFERDIKKAGLGFKYISSSEIYTAFIGQAHKGTIQLTFPQLELSHFPPEAKKIKISNFFPSKSVELSDGTSQYTWKLHMTSLKGEMAADLLKSSFLSVSHSSAGAHSEDSEDILEVFCLDESRPTSLDKIYFKSSQQKSVVTIPRSHWLKVLRFVKNPIKDMTEIRNIIPQLPPLSESTAIDIDTSKEYPFMDCDIKSTLAHSEVLKVWLTWSMRDPVISPAIQLVEISPLLRICVQHNSRPAECFSDPKLSQASKSVYNSINEYIDLWKKVLLAEAAQASVKEGKIVIIRDVHLKWPELIIPPECIEEQYYVPSNDVEMVLPKSFIDHCYEFFKVTVGDLVCVRYGCDRHQSTRAVFHFVVHRVEGELHSDKGEPHSEEKKKELLIAMKNMGAGNCRISEEMKRMLESKECACEVQITTLSYSYR